jgi:predicted glycogen debranching enzyme
MSASISLPVRRLAWPVAGESGPDALVSREWLVTNGLGGYASGTVAGVITRRYHGLLIAALPAPCGRTVMLSHLADEIRWRDGRQRLLGDLEWRGGAPSTIAAGTLVEFRLDAGMPVWRYDIDGLVIEKRVFFTHMQNTVQVIYELLGGDDDVEIALRPSMNFRAQEFPVSEPLGAPYEFRAVGDRHEVVLPASGLPALRMVLRAEGASFILKGKQIDSVLYPVEESRGYQAHGDLWSPGYYRAPLRKGLPIGLVASTESFDTMTVLSPADALQAELDRRSRLIAQADPAARSGVGAELVLAADQFIITPAGRYEEAARARASGDEVRTVIAGYHWFTDWGRDTMISLEGLTLVTGRHIEAGYILRTFAHYVRDGLIPNMFPEGEKQGLYHTADATLWLFHAIARYLACSHDDLTLSALYPTLKRIVAAHVQGTHFGIHVDPADDLLTQGAEGYQLTWMDAKVDDWVVTPRRGKAVEINALWYNALRVMEQWAAERGDPDASDYGRRADRVEHSFNRRFWYEDGGYLYDIVDGEVGGTGGTVSGVNDARCRPNQLLAIALPHAVLNAGRWEQVVRVTGERLLTPVGLRSLAPGDADFKSRYYGDLRSRDAAYHQGTVWGWLVGPYVDAYLKVFPEDQDGARRAVEGFVPHLSEACIGSISEVFDADRPFTARGCIAQAWSVAEVLRIWIKLAGQTQQPSARVEQEASRSI